MSAQHLIRFLGTMENSKAAETGSNPAGGTTSGQTMNGNGGTNPDPSTIPNPKLGMAPLSSELAVAAASNNIPPENHQPQDRSPPNPPQSAESQSTQTSVPPTTDVLQLDPAIDGPSQVPTIPTTSEQEQAPQMSDPRPSLPETALPPPDPTSIPDIVEQPRLPDSDPTPPDPPPANPQTGVGSHLSNDNSNPKEMS